MSKEFSTSPLREGFQFNAQAGLIAGGCISMQDSLANGAVDQRESLRQQGPRCCLVLGVNRGAELLDLITKTGAMCAIPFRANTGLLDTL